MDLLYKIHNGPMPTTAAQAVVTTGTAVKTLLQIAAPATVQELQLVEWGISFDGAADAAKIKCEIFSCTGAATVTAAVAADINRMSNPNGPASQVQLGTALTGYTASAEGTPANVRMHDYQLVSPAGGYSMQWPLGREPRIAIATFVRVRVTAAAAVNASCYVIWAG